MVEALRPAKGGFVRSFGTGWFIREFLAGHSPYGSPRIDPARGSPQADIFHWYKLSLIRTSATDKAIRHEENQARQEGRRIDPDKIDTLIDRYISKLPFKTSFCRYHSFVSYFNILQQLHWVEPSGITEPSTIQDNYSGAPPRTFYRLTETGISASDKGWANPRAALYGKT